MMNIVKPALINRASAGTEAVTSLATKKETSVMRIRHCESKPQEEQVRLGFAVIHHLSF